jgi:transcriptional repressor NrdR
LIAQIEGDLRDNYDEEVSSMVIGEMVMKGLKDIDEVAYVRFASVYKQFADLNSFVQTIEQLQKPK